MKTIAKPDGMKFKARIRRGASIGQDHSWSKWPNLPYREVKAPVDLVFDAQDLGSTFSLEAEGYGKRGAYGNGSIYVYSINDLIVSAKDRERVLARLRADKLKELEEAEEVAAKLRAKLTAMLQPPPARAAKRNPSPTPGRME